ncbi:S1 family peptidase [Klebsiella grimontii]|uniref:S1 family peptidase n=1 Tax=Klebsiella grimontii TaxID=2058152 RepID=UPI00189BCBA4|nr:serine protease [Klebsiella grimontii]
MHQNLANATFQVLAGNSCGSGFSFMRDNLVVTNFHVVKQLIDLKTKTAETPAIIVTEFGKRMLAFVVKFDEENDFAIMRIPGKLPDGRTVLQPSTNFVLQRGARVIFAGYPHGVPQLLTNEGIVSAPLNDGRFAIDGMVNGGNSGGPIIDARTGEAIGIVTQRRFILGGQSRALNEEATRLRNYLSRIPSGGVGIKGIDFGQFADLLGRSLQLVTTMLESNANSGIGTGFSLIPVVAAINELPA